MHQETTTEKIWNAEGLFPGPFETKEIFLKRVDYCLNLRNSFFSEFPDLKGEIVGGNYFEEAFSLTFPLFGCRPSWPPLLFSNHQLLPWQGGCAWIFEKEKNAPLGAFFQLRRPFKKNKRYLRIYERKELIAHEMAHAARLAFKEPKFEEIFAYRTSHSPWRRFLGPLFQSPWESGVFVLLLLLILGINSASLFEATFFPLISWSLVIFVLFTTALFARLLLRQWTWHRCRKNLSEIFGDQTDFLLFRLTDAEIKRFSKLPKDKILAYMQQEPSYRWEFLRKVYGLSNFA